MASGSRVPNNSTSMSLHERFSKLRSAGQVKISVNLQASTRRQTAIQQQKASSKNNRLNQQMEKRAASIAALKLKKKSIKQRLGSQATYSTGARLRGPLTQNQRKLPNSRGAARGNRAPVSTPNPVRTNRSTSTGRLIASQTIVRGAGRGRGRATRGSVNKRVTTVSPPVHRSATTTTPTRGRGRGNLVRRGRGGAQRTPNAVVQVQRGRGRGRGRGQTRDQPIQQRAVRGQSSQPSRGRGQNSRGRGRGGAKPKVSKEDLDKDLDQYMSRTRGALNRELDNYMGGLSDMS